VPKTHHATRTFRLSCGCLRDYPGMATGKVHEVLCPACHVAARTLYVYPEKRCGIVAIVELPDKSVMRVSCTREEGNKNCHLGVHHDEFVKTSFTLPAKLRKGGWGQTGRV